MRPIFILFVMGITGFGFILHKKDASEATGPKPKVTESRQLSQHNWMKHAAEQGRVVAQNSGQQSANNELR